MEEITPKFAIVIATKNRIKDLIFTLNSLKHLINRDDVECVVYDDGSTDGTFNEVKLKFPNVKLLRNETSKGYLYCRNMLLNQTKAKFAISLDDDAHFLSENPLELIDKRFVNNPNCGVVAFRVYWGKNEPYSILTNQQSEQVKGFVGCGHAWRMEAWKKSVNYPEWFVFYGEEEFTSFYLFKQKTQIIYSPDILIHHRVDVKSRKKSEDYTLRLRQNFRSGWYIYFLFYPLKEIPRKLLYTFWVQLKTKTFKGDFKASLAIIQGVFDVLFNLPKLIKQSNRLSLSEYHEYMKLTDSKIFWKPKSEKTLKNNQ